MNTRLIALTVGFFATAASVRAEGPCHDRREAKHAARKALHQCIEAWAHDRRPEDADPTDDCQAKLSAFVQGAKDVKACFAEKMKERQEKREQKHK